MAIIKTERNVVYAYDRQDDDVFLQVAFQGVSDTGIGTVYRKLRLLNIDTYQDVVDWAVGMADQMAYPIHVLPVSYDAFMRKHEQTFRACSQDMDHQEWGKLRQELVASMAEIMRDCDEQEVRATAYEVLVMLKVIH